MANTSTTKALTSLDHATQKAALKDFLRGEKPLFKDLDYEGSNINLQMDLLAYNSFLFSFYTNMMFAESFLDSAKQRSSIVSHAKDLNYLPQSVRSARAQVKVDFSATGLSQPYTIPRGSQFTVFNKQRSLTFTTAKKILCSSPNTSFTFTTDIYEGVYLSDVYLFSPSSDIQRFQISNQDVDTNSLVVTVYEDGSQYGDTYKVADSLLGLEPTSKVFFVQATKDGYYEILFGDNIFGRRPKAQSVIRIEYRVSAGDFGNGSRVFSCDFDCTGVGEMTSAPIVTLIEQGVEGAARESNESIRAYAPRYFAAQQRAVAHDDYKALVLAKFPEKVDDVNVYGGETQEPKLYGRVIVAIKPRNGTVAADFLKQNIINTMRNYLGTTRMLIADPEYFYLGADIVVQFDTAATTKQVSELKADIQAQIEDWAGENLQKFGKDFRYSRFVNLIDTADESFVSNETVVTMIKRLTPTLDYPTTFSIEWGNAIHQDKDGDNLVSTPFTFVSADGVYYEFAYLRDDGAGSLDVWAPVANKDTLIQAGIGTVDYTGKTTINKLLVNDYTNHISLKATLASKDIIMDQKNILMVDLEDITISLKEQVS